MLSRVSRVCLLAGLSVSVGAPALAQQDWVSSVWQTAFRGENEALVAALTRYPTEERTPDAWLAGSIESLRANLQKNETERAEQIATATADLDKALAEPATDESLSKALRSAVELHMLRRESHEVLEEPRVVQLTERARDAALVAEARGDLFTASELFSRLNMLHDVRGTFKDDVTRQNTRLLMVRLYAPEQFWKMRNDRRIAEGEKALPPYNPMGDSWQEKLDGISRGMVMRALSRSASQHVEQIGLDKMLTGGLEAVRTMITTDDVGVAFPRVRDQAARNQMLAFLRSEAEALAQGTRIPRYSDLDGLLDRLEDTNSQSTQIAETALLHEFANGAMSALDEFSSIVWPDEIRGFNRSTQGNFVGVGIQIQLDDLARIKVVTPLDDTPAQRAGVRPGDLIVRVNGQTTEGLSLDQAVNVITGPEGSRVNLTVERDVDGETIEKDMNLARKRIAVTSVKGWRKLGLGEGEWDWFVDPQQKIGYVRLTGFTERTDADFDRAIEQMKGAGVQGLILDLRFNPGGLMDQAVAVVSRFIDIREDNKYQGLVVSTHVQDDKVVQRETIQPGRATLAGLPVVVLVNEGSASASEIVSGALKDYAQSGELRGLVLGEKTYGKGSVQNVWQVPGQGVVAALKLTTQYYKLPDGETIHRTRGAADWGVHPNLTVDMLPKQIADAFVMRQNADVILLDDNGQRLTGEDAPPNPDDLIAKGLDLQLQHAVVVLQSQTPSRAPGQALLPVTPDPSRKN